MSDKLTDIVFMRHGDALSKHESGVSYDSERILSQEGHKNAFTSAQKLKSLNFSPDTIITSPFIRAVQTAEIISSTFEKNEIQILAELAAPKSIPTLLEILLKKETAGKSLIAVGHMPTVNLLAELIIPKISFHFNPAGFAYIRLNAQDFLKHSKNNGHLVEFYN
ncbi:MAG: phosphohistidine phosphatase SixA [Elusimicrobiota bacterium]|nr:phosphohistidine phosphatase SixA [Elusimicrobiota bacterium]